MTSKEATNRLTRIFNRYCRIHDGDSRCDNECDFCNRCKDCYDKEVFDMAVEALEKAERCKWHDLRKNKDDLPEVGKTVVTFWKFHNTYLYTIDNDITDDVIKLIINGYGGTEICMAWRYIEPFEEEK